MNLMIVMLLGGLWHGAGWNYLLWGGAHGLALVAERLLTGKRAKASIFGPGRIREAISMLFVFHVVTVLWLFFILPDVESFQAYWKSVFSRPMSISPNIGFGILLFGIPVVLQHLWGLFGKGKKSFCEDGLVDDQGALSTPECIVLGTMLALIVLNSGTAGQFIYFQF